MEKMKLGPSGDGFSVNSRAVAVSFEIAKLIANEKKSYTIGERLIKRSLLKTIEIMFGEESRKRIQLIPLSNDRKYVAAVI